MEANPIQKNLRYGVRAAGIPKHATRHRLGHSFATHLIEAGYGIRTVLELMGHSDVKTTQIDTYVLQRGSSGARSLVDALLGAKPEQRV